MTTSKQQTKKRRSGSETVVMPVRYRGPMRVSEVNPVGSGRWWGLRVLVSVDGAECPMQVVIPAPPPGRVPCPGALVRLGGLRVVFRTIGGRCRPVVRADGVEVVG